ncbi:ankyrin-3-like [Gigantopelta aegis]|uniref:ankyrin-3-like n=1 Tax=Gigantopelta aegis TaxID=1735272 RepID=UPI001B887F78|nr:ankyrin-3-like [Gigantopelta aegis]
MDHDPFDDSSFHESVIGDTSETSDAYPAARSSTASLIPNSPGFEHDELTRRFSDIANKLGSEWQRLALNLGLVKKDIDQFMNEHPRHLMLQAYTMLSFWYEKEGKSASKDALVRGLQESELNSIAELLEV